MIVRNPEINRGQTSLVSRGSQFPRMGRTVSWLVLLGVFFLTTAIQADNPPGVTFELRDRGDGSCCYDLVYINDSDSVVEVGAISLEALHDNALIGEVVANGGLTTILGYNSFIDSGKYLFVHPDSATRTLQPRQELIIGQICFPTAPSWARYNGDLLVDFEVEIAGKLYSCNFIQPAKICLPRGQRDICCDGIEFEWVIERDPCNPDNILGCTLRYSANFSTFSAFPNPLDERPSWYMCHITNLRFNNEYWFGPNMPQKTGTIPARLLGDGDITIEMFDGGVLRCTRTIERPAECP